MTGTERAVREAGERAVKAIGEIERACALSLQDLTDALDASKREVKALRRELEEAREERDIAIEFLSCIGGMKK